MPKKKPTKKDKRLKNPSRRSGYNAGIKTGLETGRRKGYAKGMQDGYAKARTEYDEQLLDETSKAANHTKEETERRYAVIINDLKQENQSDKDRYEGIIAGLQNSKPEPNQQIIADFIKKVDSFIETKHLEVVHNKSFFKTETMHTTIDAFNVYGWRKLKTEIQKA